MHRSKTTGSITGLRISYNLMSYFFQLFMLFTMLSCGKDNLADEDNPPGGNPPEGTLANYNVIDLPTVNLDKLIIPNLKSFWVTNRGPYIQVQNTSALRWSVYKYHGSFGSQSWSSFNPNFSASFFLPTNFSNEKDREFAITWCSTDLDPDKYGNYYLNNGSPTFEYEVPGGSRGPERFQKVIPSRKGLMRSWAIFGDEVWLESVVASPKTFEHIDDVPVPAGEFIDAFCADPQDETSLWCATQTRLFEVGSVGIGAGTKPGIRRSWNFSQISTSNSITAIIKVGTSIVIQFGKAVYQQDGNSFKKIGELKVTGNATANICTNGSTIYASDGTYYSSTTSSWESYIGNGENLSQVNAKRYADLQGYCSADLPIGVLNGSVSGPVYLLSPTKLIEIFPK
ncbi:hypothetical protein [Flavitalea sp.]|nr:hypothetical protein [Flavitalea sp.]